jgi:Ca2+-binding EF-hand superfamily protein
MPRKATVKHDRQSKHADADMLAPEFSEQEILEFREAFAMFDIDGGGT